jgi:hypothetical protein
MKPPKIAKLFLSMVVLALGAVSASAQCPREANVADHVAALRCAKLIYVTSHHDRFTKYVFTAIDKRSNVVVASGKLSSLMQAREK